MSKPLQIDLNTAEGRAAFIRTQGGMVKAGDKPNRKVKKGERERLEGSFLEAWGVVEPNPRWLPVLQYRFDPIRRWRFDFAWLDAALAVEIQGGTFIRGGHSRGAQQEKDFEKLREASRMGWVVLQYGSKAMGDPMVVAAEVADILRKRIQEQSK